MRLSRTAMLSLILLLALGTAVRADVRLPAIFGNNMVIQQGMPVPVWGRAEPGEKVKVSFAGQVALAEADSKGRWKATLPPMAARVEPGSLTVSGANTLVFTNVVVGEVWICSGQSNMALKGNYVRDAEKEILAANWPLIRLFTVEMMEGESELPREDVVGSWTPCTPRTMRYFSAVGYFFGREVQGALGVPVGLVNSSRGGSPAEGWTRHDLLTADPELKESVDLYEKRKTDVEGEKRKFDSAMAAWEKRALAAKAAGRPEPHRPTWMNPADVPARPGHLWNGMIAPLMPYAIRGVIWYQGESNATRADRYAKLFPALIRDWRTQWGQGDFPFLYVQLASVYDRFDHPTDHPWARLREVQLKTLAVTNTGMAVTVDLGDQTQPAKIHPEDKKEVGMRLAACAFQSVYGKREVVPSGPLFDRMTVEGDRVRVSFTQLGGGLENRAEGGIKGFALAGEDRQFAWADARIDGDSVVVSSPKVKQPVAVRYGWAGNPEVSLFNKAGLPASPFRSDDWPFVKEPASTPVMEDKIGHAP